jgi:hypothetical protein
MLARNKTRPTKRFADLCQEAVRAHGTNWWQVERYVSARLNQLPAEERAAIMQDIDRVLSYASPGPGISSHN